jgi:hypothetical protein
VSAYTFTKDFSPNILTILSSGVVGTKARGIVFSSGGDSSLSINGTVRGHATVRYSLTAPITTTITLPSRVKGAVAPATVFSEFAHYTAAATVDPVVSLVKAKSSGLAAYDATQPSGFRRVSMSLTLPNDTSTTRRAAYVAPGIRIASLAQNNGVNIDGTQVEVSVAGATTPSAYEPARALQVGVRPNRLNYACNPSWRNTSGTVTVRTNLATNPSAETAVGYTANSGAWTVTSDTTVKRSGTASKKSVTTTTGSTSTLLSMYNCGGINIPATAGLTYTASAYFAHNAAVTANSFVAIQFLDAGSALLQTTTGASISTAGDSAFSRAFVTGTAPTGTATIRVTATVTRSSGVSVAGDAAWIDDCLVEQTGALMPYFDGRTATADGLTYGWTGTVDASTSTAVGPAFATYPFTAYGSAMGWQSAPGVLRLLNPNALTSGIWGFGANGGLVLTTPGSYYAMRFKVRQVGGTGAVSIIPRLGYYTQPGATQSTTGMVDSTVTLPPDGPWVEFIGVARDAANATAYSVRPLIYQNVVPPQGTVLEFKECIIERVSGSGVTPGTYFDGSSGADYLWEAGTVANDSRSYFYEDYAVRAYLLKQVLAENCPLGTIPGVPQFAVLPRF